MAPWNSAGYDDCYDDLKKAAAKYRIRLDVPIKDLTAEEWTLLHEGRSKWYGIKGFFEWLETKKYKIHVRVKLAKYRSYETCPQCHGSRLKSSASFVTFRGLTVGDVSMTFSYGGDRPPPTTASDGTRSACSRSLQG